MATFTQKKSEHTGNSFFAHLLNKSRVLCCEFQLWYVKLFSISVSVKPWLPARKISLFILKGAHSVGIYGWFTLKWTSTRSSQIPIPVNHECPSGVH